MNYVETITSLAELAATPRETNAEATDDALTAEALLLDCEPPMPQTLQRILFHQFCTDARITFHNHGYLEA